MDATKRERAEHVKIGKETALWESSQKIGRLVGPYRL